MRTDWKTCRVSEKLCSRDKLDQKCEFAVMLIIYIDAWLNTIILYNFYLYFFA